MRKLVEYGRSSYRGVYSYDLVRKPKGWWHGSHQPFSVVFVKRCQYGGSIG
jgi:hypothetical protein